jgi:peptidyl-prolyl cis-trans isomerase SurA
MQSRFMLLPPAALIATALLLLSPRPAPAQETLRIVAVVNDQVISALDLGARVDFEIIATGQKPTMELRRRLAGQVLRQLVDEKLQLQEADDKDIKISDEEIIAAVAGIEQDNHMPPGGVFQLLDQAHIPHDTVLNQLRARMAWQRAVMRKLRMSTQIGDDDIDDALADLRANIGKPESQVSEIYLNADTPDAEEEAKKTADRLVAQARNGGNFGALARQFSDSATAAVEGDLGWVHPHQLDPVLDAALETMQKGDVSDPIKSARGFYILKLRDRHIAQVVDPNTVEVKLSQITFPLSANASPDEVASQTQLAQQIGETVTGCPDMDTAGKEAGGHDASTNLAVKMGELAPEIRAAITDLPLGKASAPVHNANGITVLMVCQRSNDGLPTREEVRQHIMLTKLDAQGRRYLRDLRQAAFVDVRQ